MGVYIWNDTKPELELKQIFDFTTTDLKGFTMQNTQANGVQIVTSGGYLTGYPSGSTNGNGGLYKLINAKRFWGRIKFLFIAHAGGVGIGPFNVSPVTNSQIVSCLPYNNTIEISIRGTVYSTSYTISQNIYYYLDFKFENGLYTAILYDNNMTKLAEKTNQTADTEVKYSGVCLWGTAGSGNSSGRIYEYREAYDNIV